MITASATAVDGRRRGRGAGRLSARRHGHAAASSARLGASERSITRLPLARAGGRACRARSRRRDRRLDDRGPGQRLVERPSRAATAPSASSDPVAREVDAAAGRAGAGGARSRAAPQRLGARAPSRAAHARAPPRPPRSAEPSSRTAKISSCRRRGSRRAARRRPPDRRRSGRRAAAPRAPRPGRGSAPRRRARSSSPLRRRRARANCSAAALELGERGVGGGEVEVVGASVKASRANSAERSEISAPTALSAAPRLGHDQRAAAEPALRSRRR